MFRYLFSVISLLFIITSPCVGDIASSGYVNMVRDNVQAKIDNKANNANYEQNMVLQTDGSGNVIATTVGTDLLADGAIQTMHLANGAVTNADLAGMIDITKLNLGTLPTSGKHIMIWNAETNEYVFEKYADSTSSGLQCDAGTYDIGFGSCISASTNGSGAYGYWDFCGDIDGDDTYGLTGPGQWASEFSYGVVKGIASCNSTPGKHGVATDQEFSNTSNGRYCWCKMTSPAASRWVFDEDDYDADSCDDGCVSGCASRVQFYSSFRPGVFGSVGLE